MLRGSLSEVTQNLTFEPGGFGAGLSKPIRHAVHEKVLASTYQVSLPARTAPHRPHAANASPAAREAPDRLARIARSQALSHLAVLYW